MALKRVTFIGNPDNPADRPPFAEPYGQRFPLDCPRDVELSDFVIGKLSANRHFKVEDVPAETPDEKDASTSSGVAQGGETLATIAPDGFVVSSGDVTVTAEGSAAPVEVETPSVPESPPPIEVRRSTRRRSSS